jgi:hypothetical protein
MVKGKFSSVACLMFCFTAVFSQEKTIRNYKLEYGLRVAQTTPLYNRQVDIFDNDVGTHFFDGFFIRINKSRTAFRLGAAYFSSNFHLFPYYEKTPDGLRFTKTEFVEFFGGIQYRPGKQKLLYLHGNLVYSSINKEGYVYGLAGPVFLITTSRRAFGIVPGFGIKQKLGDLIALSLEYRLNILWQTTHLLETYAYIGGEFINQNITGIKHPSSLQLLFTLEIR